MSRRLRFADRRLPITMDHIHIRRTGRRSRRDWVVDIVMFVLAVLFGLFAASQRIAAPVQPPWLFEVDQVVGALGCAALWLRRRWPTQLAVVLVAASAFSEMVAGAMLAALFTVAVHRSKRVSWAVFLFSLLAAVAYTVLRPDPQLPPARSADCRSGSGWISRAASVRTLPGCRRSSSSGSVAGPGSVCPLAIAAR